MALPRVFNHCHILFRLDRIRYDCVSDEVDKWMNELGFYSVDLFEKWIAPAVTVGSEHIVLKRTWCKGMPSKWHYPRFHVIPKQVYAEKVGGQYVIGVYLEAHIDEREHLVDRSPEAGRKCATLLAGIKQMLRVDFSDDD